MFAQYGEPRVLVSAQMQSHMAKPSRAAIRQIDAAAATASGSIEEEMMTRFAEAMPDHGDQTSSPRSPETLDLLK